MRNVRRVLRITVFLIVGLFLHYILPQQDVAIISGVETKRADFSAVNRIFYSQADAGTTELSNRDVNFFDATRKRTFLLGLVRGGDQTMVYRNEDTGWIYPPYFKFDSSDLRAEARALVSTAEDPKWVVITHYGWRIRFLTVHPNAVSIREVPGPDYRPFPWVNLIVFVAIIIGALFVRAMWMQFRERTLDPLTDKAGDRLDVVNADLAERSGRFRRWLDTWRGK